jgi:DNA-binding MarR family transcriptional regulator
VNEPRDTVPRALGHLRVALEHSYLEAGRGLGLTPPQAELLCAAMQPTAVGRLARTLRCDRTNVTHHVDRAVQRGWVERRSDERDRRTSMIALTPEGEQLARRFIATLEAQLVPLLGGWSDRRQTQGAAMLREIANALDDATARAARPVDD